MSSLRRRANALLAIPDVCPAAGPAQLGSALLGCLQADLRSFRHQRSLELGNGPKDMEHQLACGCPCVAPVRD